MRVKHIRNQRPAQRDGSIRRGLHRLTQADFACFRTQVRHCSIRRQWRTWRCPRAPSAN